MDEETKELLRVIRDVLLRKEQREEESAKKMDEFINNSRDTGQAMEDRILADQRRKLRETRFAIFGAFLAGLIFGYLGFLFAYRSYPP